MKPEPSGRTTTRRRILLTGGALAASLCVPTRSRAQPAGAWPRQPIKLHVGFAPGGVTDGLPRLYAPALSERLGVPVVVENKVGAAGNIATTYVAKSAPDGYNLLASGVGQIVVLPHTSTMEVNPLSDLVHIAMVADGDQILNVAADVPARNLAEFIAYVKSNPGKVFMGTAGPGGNQHLYLEYFRTLAGLEMQAVHYRGGGPMMTDLLANRVQISLNAPAVVEPHIATGKLRPLMIVGAKRNPKMPDVPTATEAGFKAMEPCSNWLGLHAPKGTPDAVVQTLYKALNDAMQTEAVRTGLARMGMYAVMNTPQQFATRIAADHELFGKIAKASNVRAE
jgi:tripartite-type tricarboxylate transporter receptor subunit TctC